MTGLHLAQYRIDAELGRGGMGIVYRATDTKLNRTVALKVLPAAALSSEEDRARFFREAQAAAQLNHPNVCHVYQVDEATGTDAAGAPVGGSDGKRPFIAMEFIEGGTLQDVIRKAPLKLSEAVRIAAQVAEALKAAHAKNIVHRDIKSANVMLTPEGVAKVLDFGLAKTNQSTMLTRMGSTLGTVAYMSPEQARGQEVDGRSDLYSLGTVMYEMIAGRLPFAADYEQAVVYGILNESPEPLTSLRTGVPVGLEWIVDKLLAKEPRHRYQTAADLVADLETVDLGGSGLSRRTRIPGTAVLPTGGGVLPNVGGSRASVPRWVWGALLAAIVIGAASGVVLGGRKGDPAPRHPMVASILLPNQSRVSHPSIAPDARYVAFTAWPILQLYDASSGTTRELVRDTNPRLSRFSPDGRWLAFEEGTGLSIVQIPDGVPARLTDVGATPSWMDDEWIAFNLGDGIRRVSRVSQRVETLWEPAEADTFRLDHPFVLPGAREVLVSILGKTGSSIGILNLADGDVRLLVERAIAPSFVTSGHLLFTEQPGAVTHNGRLFAQPFDPESGETRGPAVPVLSSRGFWEVGVSDNGDLVTSAGIAASLTSDQDQLHWLDPETGGTTMIDRLLPDTDAMGLSPDGETLWYKAGQAGQIFVGPLDPLGGSPLEIARGAFGGAVLSADSIYYHKGSPSVDLATYVRSVGGSEAERRVSFLGRRFEGIWDLAADGRTGSVFSGDTWDGDAEFYLVTLDDRAMNRLQVPPRAADITISPDRKWISYHLASDGYRHFIAGTDGSGPWEVASPLQGTVWLNDSRSVLMRDATGLYVIDLDMDRGVRPAGPPRLIYSGTSEMFYVVNRATGKVLVADRASADRGTESRLDLIIAWGERLKQEAPVQ